MEYLLIAKTKKLFAEHDKILMDTIKKNMKLPKNTEVESLRYILEMTII